MTDVSKLAEEAKRLARDVRIAITNQCMSPSGVNVALCDKANKALLTTIDRLAALAQAQAAQPVDTGPRDAPPADHILFVLYEIGRFARGVKMGRAVHGLCPAGCGCLWRDNFDGTMSLGYNQRSCRVCEATPFDRLIPLFAASPAPGLEEAK